MTEAEAFGSQFFITYPDMPIMVSLKNNQELLVCKCWIDIRDDDGNIILYAEGLGGQKSILNQSGKASGLKNMPEIASRQAFKGACKTLNIFDVKSVEEDGESKTDNIYNKEDTRKVWQISPREKKMPCGVIMLSSQQVNAYFRADNTSYKLCLYGYESVPCGLLFR